MSTWKPIAAFIATTIGLTVLMVYGLDHRTGLPNGLGYALLAVLTAEALAIFR